MGPSLAEFAPPAKAAYHAAAVPTSQSQSQSQFARSSDGSQSNGRSNQTAQRSVRERYRAIVPVTVIEEKYRMAPEHRGLLAKRKLGC